MPRLTVELTDGQIIEAARKVLERLDEQAQVAALAILIAGRMHLGQQALIVAVEAATIEESR